MKGRSWCYSRDTTLRPEINTMAPTVATDRLPMAPPMISMPAARPGVSLAEDEGQSVCELKRRRSSKQGGATSAQSLSLVAIRTH